uniref:Nucleotide-diphospho-sugar transferase domain-containing protein n=3 Tax=Panagrolaimus sp. JU765 TaxID=591449 RepID=A0AC34RGR7_9BILA
MSRTTTLKQRVVSSAVEPSVSNGFPASGKQLSRNSANSRGRQLQKQQCSILWPSRFLNAIFGPRIYRLILYCTYAFWFICGVFVLRKTEKATASLNYIRHHAATVSLDSIETSQKFKELVQTLDRDFTKPPAFLFLNQFALNMTFNFLCNTAEYPGVHERLIFVTLDEPAKLVLEKNWPKIRQFYWPTESLFKPFSFSEGAYQLIYLLRANLAVALLKNGKSFWMMQQDTFWRESLFDKNLEDGDFDALFDQIGANDDDLRAEWVNGANFFVKANADTLKFFEAVASKLVDWHTPDMGIMIHQCHTWDKPKCKFISHKIAHSWEWMYTDQKDPPSVMQLDCETDGRSKLQELAKFGFYFTKEDGRTCNPEAVKKAAQKMIEGRIEIGRHSWLMISWGKFQFRMYWYLVDCILWLPYVGPFLKPYMPLVGPDRDRTTLVAHDFLGQIPIPHVLVPGGLHSVAAVRGAVLETLYAACRVRAHVHNVTRPLLLHPRLPCLSVNDTGYSVLAQVFQYLIENKRDLACTVS